MLAMGPVQSRVRSFTLLLMAAVLAAALFSAAARATNEPEATIRGEGGPSKFYSHGGQCSNGETTGGATDPVGVIFEGEHAGPSNVSDFIGEKTGWKNTALGIHATIHIPYPVPYGDDVHVDVSDQSGLRVKQPDGSYLCRVNDAANAEGSHPVRSRFHVRLWYVPGSAGGDNSHLKTVGTPHHEDWKWEINNPGCDLAPPIAIGNHAVDEGGVESHHPDASYSGYKNSGFDRARHVLREHFEAGGWKGRIGTENWGNTNEHHQCDGGWAGSDGNGIVIPIKNSLHTGKGKGYALSTGGGRLTAFLATEEARTEYWFAYGSSPSQGVNGYPSKTSRRVLFGSSRGDVSALIAELPAGKTLYLRLFAENQAGEVSEGAEGVYRTCADTTSAFGVDLNGTGSHQTEVHVLDSKTNFGSFSVHAATALEETGPDKWQLGPADYDCNGSNDLFAVAMNNTQSGQTEVHVLNGSTNYSSYQLHAVTGLHSVSPKSWQMLEGYWDGDLVPDLFAVDMNGTGSGKTEVHILSGSSNYSSFALHAATELEEVDPEEWQFAPVDWDRDGTTDVLAVKLNHTGSGMTEAHILDGASNFNEFSLHAVTALHEGGTKNWQFFTSDYNHDGRPDLYAINLNGTQSHTTEVHIMDGATNFSTWLAHDASPLQEVSARSWQFGGAASAQEEHEKPCEWTKGSDGAVAAVYDCAGRATHTFYRTPSGQLGHKWSGVVMPIGWTTRSSPAPSQATGIRPSTTTAASTSSSAPRREASATSGGKRAPRAGAMRSCRARSPENRKRSSNRAPTTSTSSTAPPAGSSATSGMTRTTTPTGGAARC